MDWWIWLIVAIVLVVVEMLTLDLVLLMIAGGALAAALASGLGVDNLLVQGLIWAVVSLLLLGTARRWILERFRGRDTLSETNVHSYVGKAAQTLTDVTMTSGRVKFHGEVWSARTATGQVPPHTTVTVVAIDGATAIVEPLA